MYGLDQGRFTVAAGACGVVRACLERSVAYARERETFGKPIGKHQFVQDMIAEMVLGYETSKLLVMQAAWLKDKGVRNTRETSLAKWHATESAFKAAHLAIQVHGAYGYSAEYGVERYFRNARAPIIYEGTTQIHKLMQAEHALGYRRLNGKNGDASPSRPGLRRCSPLSPTMTSSYGQNPPAGCDVRASSVRSSSRSRLPSRSPPRRPRPSNGVFVVGESLGGAGWDDQGKIAGRVGPDARRLHGLRPHDVVLGLGVLRREGRGVVFVRGRAVHLFTLWKPFGWHTRTASSWAPPRRTSRRNSSSRRSGRAMATRRSSRRGTRASARSTSSGASCGASACFVRAQPGR